MDSTNYIINSLELHLFFGRIMKEHALFLRAGFTPVNADFASRALFFKREFERLLSRAVALGNGIVSREVVCSGELVTEFTARAERQTEAFTGIPIDKSITARELNLECGGDVCDGLVYRVKELNVRALELLCGLIEFKERILKNVLCCKMFTGNYPLLTEHIIREAKLYREYISTLEENGCIDRETMRNTECFWNQIMMEHALFIRGLLDPTENELITKADCFAGDYAKLLDACGDAHNKTMQGNSLETTVKFRDFKAAGVSGIEECKVRSLILPLLADHVLREANHYIRLLS